MEGENCGQLLLAVSRVSVHACAFCVSHPLIMELHPNHTRMLDNVVLIGNQCVRGNVRRPSLLPSSTTVRPKCVVEKGYIPTGEIVVMVEV